MRPDNAELHSRAIEAYQSGKNRLAIRLFLNLIGQDKHNQVYYSDLSIILDAPDTRVFAAKAAINAIVLEPCVADFYLNLGVISAASNDIDRAILLYRRCVIINPNDVVALTYLAELLCQAGSFDDAVALANKALSLDKAFPRAYAAIASALRMRGDYLNAVDFSKIAIAHDAGLLSAYIDLSASLFVLGRYADAQAAANGALARDPSCKEAHSILAGICFERDEQDSAEPYFRNNIIMNPDYTNAYVNNGLLCIRRIQVINGLRNYERALLIDPNNVDANWNYAIALLLNGQMFEGWRYYEWRWKRHDMEQEKYRQYPVKPWSVNCPKGSSVLIWSEQGFGDILHFCRYAPLLHDLGMDVIFEVPEEMKRLMSSLRDTKIVPERHPLPQFDAHVPLMSLPYLLGTDIDSIPAQVPYLSANLNDVAYWRHRLAALPGLKIGLVWAGEPRCNLPRAYSIDKRRSMSLLDFSPILSLPNIRFISLQKGHPASQIADLLPELRPLDWMDEIEDFADTAALIENLDLVISVDTSVAHLAGALGKPVWILSRFDGCWRWLLDRDDSPWYPTARLFRQSKAGDWRCVIEKVCSELSRLGNVVKRH